jgi:hypothetical protein
MSDDKPQADDQQDTSQKDTGASDGEGISDDQLPADVQPTEDNPLARHPEQTGDSDDEIGADREGDPETAPLTEEDADYSDSSSESEDAADKPS